MRSSRERENSATGRGLAAAARPVPAAGNANADTSTATPHRRRLPNPERRFTVTAAVAIAPAVKKAIATPKSSRERPIDDVFHCHAQPPALRHGLRHEHHEHIFLGIDPERGAARARPAHFTHRPLDGTDADLGANGKSQSETEAG